MQKQKTLLIHSGGLDAADAAKRAREMGLYVVVSDRDPEAPAFAHADSCIIADVYSPEETLAAARRYALKLRKLDGVICIAADAPLTAATVAHHLRLPGISTETAKLAADKLAMKERFLAAGIPVPWFSPVATPQALQRMAVERGRDLVAKPVDGRGTLGVQRVTEAGDLAKAFMLARQHSPSERVMAEEFLSGHQVSAETLIVNGHCHTPVISDRNYEFLERYAPFIVENGGDLPSQLPDDMQAKVKTLVAQAANALGISNGTIKTDIVIANNEPHLIELAARLSGGFFSTREIPLATGIDFVGAAIKLALGETIAPEELEPAKSTPVVRRYAFPRPGRVTRVTGEDEARKIPGVADVIVTAKPGDIIGQTGDKQVTAAMVLATGETHEAALAAANDALSKIRIETA